MKRRWDSWVNSITGLGDSTRDKRLYGQISQGAVVQATEYEVLYNEDGLAARIVRAVPENALRQGVQLVGPPGHSPLDLARLEQRFEELDVLGKVFEAAVWGRLFGGAAILLGAGDLSQERTPDELPEYLAVLTRRDLTAVSIYSDILKYGGPSQYRITASTYLESAVVHASRLLVFGGALTTRQERERLGFWDHSVLYSCLEDVRDYESAWGAVGNMLQDCSQGILRIKGFLGLLAGRHREAFEERLQQISLARWVGRIMPIDTDEEFKYSERTFTGLEGILLQYMSRISGKTGIPQTVLFGRSPAGLNATGESDLRLWYDQIKAVQRDHYGPIIQSLVRLLAIEQGLPDPDNWTITWPSLWQESPAELVQRQKTIAEVDALYLDRGVVDSDSVALARYGSGGWSEAAPQIDLDNRARVAATRDRAQEEIEDGSVE